MKKVLLATWALRDRSIVSIELVYTPSTFFMKSAVAKTVKILVAVLATRSIVIVAEAVNILVAV